MRRVRKYLGRSVGLALVGTCYGAWRYRPLLDYETIESPATTASNWPDNARHRVPYYHHSSLEAPDPANEPLMLQLARLVVGSTCTAASNFFTSVLNRFHVESGLQHFHSALIDRPRGVGLITVANHVSLIDDPVVLASLVPSKHWLDTHFIRWSPCAQEICHGTLLGQSYFGAGKTLPIVRGAGVYQRAMDILLDKLDDGEWVHIFPEGRVWQAVEGGGIDGEAGGVLAKGWHTPGGRRSPPGRYLAPIRWGVGRLIAESKPTPIVVPIYHWGLEGALPQNAYNKMVRNFPTLGHDIHVLIGEPISFEDLLATPIGNSRPERYELYRKLTERVEQSLAELEAKAAKMRPPPPSPPANTASADSTSVSTAS